MNKQIFQPTEVTQNFYVDSVPAENRGKTFSIGDIFGHQAKKGYTQDATLHDANFAFLTTTLAKLHEKVYEPKYFVTYTQDIPINVGGGFVDYVSYYTIDWSGIMNEFRNIMGNAANLIPRVNAGMTQKRVNVYTFEVAYDLRFIDLEKMKKLTLQKSIQEIYGNIIVAGFDLFAQKTLYEGIAGTHGLFNNPNVLVTTIDNSGATGKGFVGLADSVIVAWFNGIFELALDETGMNLSILPDTILVPTFVGKDLSARYSALYTSTLRAFILKHNLAVDESSTDSFKLTIASRPGLNNIGVTGNGRVIAYRKDADFVRGDMPYPIQQYITLPNIDRMAYTTAFVGQISQIQMPYNDGNVGGFKNAGGEYGPVTYWDFIA